MKKEGSLRAAESPLFTCTCTLTSPLCRSGTSPATKTCKDSSPHSSPHNATTRPLFASRASSAPLHPAPPSAQRTFHPSNGLHCLCQTDYSSRRAPLSFFLEKMISYRRGNCKKKCICVFHHISRNISRFCREKVTAAPGAAYRGTLPAGPYPDGSPPWSSRRRSE